MASSNVKFASGDNDSKIAAAFFSRLAFPVLSRFQPISPLVIYYHVVSDRQVPHIGDLYQFRNSQEFEADLDFLLKHYEPISLADLLAARSARRDLPANSMVVTFDDGLRETAEIIAPRMARKGVPGIFFLCSAFLDNQELSYDHKKALLSQALVSKGSLTTNEEKLAWEKLRPLGSPGGSLQQAIISTKYSDRAVLNDLAMIFNVDFDGYLRKERPYLDTQQATSLLREGHALGSHSIDHPLYREIPLEEQVRQTLESTTFIRERFRLPYSVFSFPHSDSGVTKAFFDRVLGPQKLDLTFGNRGLLEDSVSENVQRTTMEKTWMPARAILGRAYTHRFYKRLSGRRTFQRPAIAA